jgi:hypothetical protein
VIFLTIGLVLVWGGAAPLASGPTYAAARVISFGTFEFRTSDGTEVLAMLNSDRRVGSVVKVSYDRSDPAGTAAVVDNTARDWSYLLLFVGVGLCVAAGGSAMRTGRRKARATRAASAPTTPPWDGGTSVQQRPGGNASPGGAGDAREPGGDPGDPQRRGSVADDVTYSPPPPPALTPHARAAALRDRTEPWSGRWPPPWEALAFPRGPSDAWHAFDTEVGARCRWVRGHRVRPGVRQSLVGAGGEIASLVSTRGRTLVMIDGVAVYRRQRGKGGWYVTEVDGGDLVLAICISRLGLRAGTEFRYPGGRALWFPVIVGTEQGVGISSSRRQVRVMFGVDERSRRVVMARTRTGSSSLQPMSHKEIDVVVCGDLTPQGMLVALLAAPLVTPS